MGNMFNSIASQKTLVNLLGANGNMVDSNADGLAEGFSVINAGIASRTCLNNEQKYTANTQYASIGVFVNDYRAGDVLYGCCYLKSSSNAVALRIVNNVTTPMNASSIGSGNYEFASVISTMTGAGAPEIKVYDTRTVSFTEVAFKLFYVFNLTQIFGAGNEPSKTAMDSFMRQQTEYFIRKDYMWVPNILINLLGTDGNFSADGNTDGLGDGWSTTGATSKSISNNIQSFVVSAKDKAISCAFGTPNANEIIYTCAIVKAPYAAVNLQLYGAASPLLAFYSGSGDWELLSVRTYYTTAMARSVFVQDTSISGWQTVQVKQVYVFNLTQIFGAGNEPTKAQMDSFMQSQSDYFVQRNYMKV